MSRTNKLIVFCIAAIMGIAFCQAAEKTKKAPAKAKPATENAANVSVQSGKDEKAWIGLGFFSPIQFPSEDSRVTVFRFATLYGYNRGVNGIDCGFVCDSGFEGVNGVQFAFANRTAGNMNGLSFGCINVVEGEMNGAQFALFNQAGSDSQDNAGASYRNSAGCQFGFVNAASNIFKGFQLGLINISNTMFKGLQFGFINLSDRPSDVFDDYESKEFKKEKKKRRCVQIGFLNFNPNGIFPVSLLINF